MATEGDQGSYRAGRGSQGPISSMQECQAYIHKRHIPQMFQSLLSALMIERPDDHLSFLEQKLSKIREIGPENVNWDTFVVNLHPRKDGVRLEHVHDDFYYKETQQKKPKRRDENYNPDVFRLTEFTQEK